MTPRGPNFFLNSGLARIVGILRFLLGVEVIEVAEELVEAVVRRQHVVAVAEMVLAELAGHIAQRLQEIRNGRIFLLHAFGRTRKAHLCEAGADRRLTSDEGGASRRTALLAIPVGEKRTLLRDLVDIGRSVAHHPTVIGADVKLADVVAPDYQNVWLLALRRSGLGRKSSHERRTDTERQSSKKSQGHPMSPLKTICLAKRAGA